MSSELLKVENLRAEYETMPKPVKAVEDVSFSVKEREVFGVCGESGCGKSTLMKAIAGLLKAPGKIVGGKILYKGTDITKLSDNQFRNYRWRDISYIPQASMNSLNPLLTIQDTLFETIRAHSPRSIPRNELAKTISESLNTVLLSQNVLRLYPHELSGGMKQRVLIACALGSSLLQPKLIVADEPTSNLDVTTERYILRLLTDLKEKFDVSIVFVTHNIAAQAQIADRVTIMYAGEVMEIGNVDVMFKDPLHPYTKALMAATPSIRGSRELSSLAGIPPDLRDPPKGCNFNPRCPLAVEGLCDVEEPKLMEVSSGRFVKCHLVK